MLKPGPEVRNLVSCSLELSMKFIMLINVKMATIVSILTYTDGLKKHLNSSFNLCFKKERKTIILVVC